MPTREPDFDLLISGGTVVAESDSFIADIGIRKGRIAAIGDFQNRGAQNHINAEDLVVIPGGVDVHVHMSLPFGGTVSSDDFGSGSRAAALGGTTTMIDFASQIPKASLCDAIRARQKEADQQTTIDYALHLIINDVTDQWLSEIPDVLALGVSTFKAFTAYPNEGLMLSQVELRELMQHAAQYGAQVDVHAEDGLAIEANRTKFVESGQTTMAYHPLSRRAATESKAILEVLSTARKTGCRIHIHHLSTADGLSHIEAATGVSVSAETCPQYLLLNASLYDAPEAALFAVSPPLREPQDSRALWAGLRSGSISMVATDHCPFLVAQKTIPDRPFTEIPNGMPGIETRVPLMFSETVVKRGFSLPLFAQIVSTNPARRFGMYPQKGTIRLGSDADLVLLDPQAHKRIDHTKLHMNCDWSPYEGMAVTGWPITTLLRGKILCQDEEWIPASPAGRFIPRTII